MIDNSIAKVDFAFTFMLFKLNIIRKICFRHATKLMKNNLIIIKFVSSRQRFRRHHESSFI